MRRAPCRAPPSTAAHGRHGKGRRALPRAIGVRARSRRAPRTPISCERTRWGRRERRSSAHSVRAPARSVATTSRIAHWPAGCHECAHRAASSATRSCGSRRRPICRRPPLAARRRSTSSSPSHDRAAGPVARPGRRVTSRWRRRTGGLRTAHLYVPASTASATKPVPLRRRAARRRRHRPTVRAHERVRRPRDRTNRFLVVYPDGVGTGAAEDQLRTWNGGVCCGAAVKQSVDDVTFLRTLVQTAVSRVPRRSRAACFATGHSNGMIMSYRLVCEAADVFVAAAGQAGTLGVDDCASEPRRSPSCTSTAPRT